MFELKKHIPKWCSAEEAVKCEKEFQDWSEYLSKKSDVFPMSADYLIGAFSKDLVTEFSIVVCMVEKEGAISVLRCLVARKEENVNLLNYVADQLVFPKDPDSIKEHKVQFNEFAYYFVGKNMYILEMILANVDLGHEFFSFGRSLLHKAVSTRCLESCRIILKYYPHQRYKKDFTGSIPLIHAAICEDIEIVKLLLKGTEPRYREMQNDKLVTALSVHPTNPDLVRVLLDGANETYQELTDHYFAAPIGKAAHAGCIESVELFINAASLSFLQTKRVFSALCVLRQALEREHGDIERCKDLFDSFLSKINGSYGTCLKNLKKCNAEVEKGFKKYIRDEVLCLTANILFAIVGLQTNNEDNVPLMDWHAPELMAQDIAVWIL
eukprot:TRINITY_DN837_c0_g1_i1.p1 TRINITY_DN837_c0_g1~~TRINITY_DN837_c0_g1_i1.p1  ORF type:complete len:382 (-),score=52.53 TRINITY_DN837_c0_g1_i1:22-1167(-)